MDFIVDKPKKEVNNVLISRSYIFSAKELVNKLGLDGELDEIILYEGKLINQKNKIISDENQKWEFLTLEQK